MSLQQVISVRLNFSFNNLAARLFHSFKELFLLRYLALKFYFKHFALHFAAHVLLERFLILLPLSNRARLRMITPTFSFFLIECINITWPADTINSLLVLKRR